MDFSEHLIISVAGSAAILAGGGDIRSAAAFTAVGVFMDLDHLADYWPQTGFNTDLARFMTFFSKRENQFMLLFLHGWEWCLGTFLGLLLAGCSLAWPYWACLAWFVHLLLDQRFNGLHPLSYFFFFRLARGFKSERLYYD